MADRREKQVSIAIGEYAKAYQRLEKLQIECPDLIPRGDQKTGCIGEFYSKLFLSEQVGVSQTRFGGHNNKGWDIEAIATDGSVLRTVQVKTVSAFAKNRGTSKVHPGWDHLYVLYLNTDLRPEGLWIGDQPAEILSKRTLTCPDPSQSRKRGSDVAFFRENRIDELLAVLGED